MLQDTTVQSYDRKQRYDSIEKDLCQGRHLKFVIFVLNMSQLHGTRSFWDIGFPSDGNDSGMERGMLLFLRVSHRALDKPISYFPNMITGNYCTFSTSLSYPTPYDRHW